MSGEPQRFGVGLTLPYDVPPGQLPDRVDAIAYVRAHLAHDDAGVKAVVDGTDPILLSACLAALAVELGARSCDSAAALDDLLLSWLLD